MARTAATIPAGMRLTDHISLGVLTTPFPRELVDQVLFETERVNARERALPAHVMVYYVLALALYAEVSTQEVLRCVVEGARWLGEPSDAERPTKSAISQARIRLGAAPLEALYRTVVAPVATAGTPRAWYRGWRVMSLDGTTLDVGDTAVNAAAFGRPASARGVNTTGAVPQIRLVGLLENGTHAITAAQLGAYGTHERVLAIDVLAGLTGEMLCLADRGFLSFDLWRTAGAPSPATRYRLVTSIGEPARAPPAELAALYHERWEIETAFDELKTHLRGAPRVLRSTTPDWVIQEAWGFLLTHFALRALMPRPPSAPSPRPATPTPSPSRTRSASSAARSPLWRLVPPQDQPRQRRAHQQLHAEIRHAVVSSSRGCALPHGVKRGVKRKMSNFPLRPRRSRRTTHRRDVPHVIIRHRPAKSWSRRSSD